MSKILKIQGSIEPEMLENLAVQIEEQAIEAGDDVDVVFNSPGGSVDVAFAIADVFEQMQDAGINMRSVAAGKVCSSAIVPFISIANRIAQRESSFTIHKATYPQLTDVNKDQLEEYMREIEGYTDMLDEYYEEHNIPENIRCHLREGDDLLLREPQDIMDAGFVQNFTNDSPGLYNRICNLVDKIFPITPQFSYIINYQTIKHMTSKQIKNMVAEAITEQMPDLIKGIVQVVNELNQEPETPTNEAAKMTSDELAKLDGVLYKTTAEVKDEPKIKYLTHPAKDIDKDHYVIPIDEEGLVVKLPAGEYEVTIVGKTFTIHSTGEDWYLSSKGEKNSVDNPDQLANIEPEAKPKEEPHVENKTKLVNTTTALPKLTTSKSPIVNQNNHAKEMHEMFSAYGAGCVGNK